MFREPVRHHAGKRKLVQASVSCFWCTWAFTMASYLSLAGILVCMFFFNSKSNPRQLVGTKYQKSFSLARVMNGFHSCHTSRFSTLSGLATIELITAPFPYIYPIHFKHGAVLSVPCCDTLEGCPRYVAYFRLRPQTKWNAANRTHVCGISYEQLTNIKIQFQEATAYSKLSRN